ncbi:MAG: hypothetical protein AAF670_05550 [Planctomycetota bacterium]
MNRFALLIFIAFHFATQSIHAGPPSRSLVVAADQLVAAAILPLSEQDRLTVLVQDQRDTYDVIEARALQLLNASTFVIGSDSNHELLPIFVERFQNHGSRIVRLPASSRIAQPRPQPRRRLSLASSAGPPLLP